MPRRPRAQIVGGSLSTYHPTKKGPIPRGGSNPGDIRKRGKYPGRQPIDPRIVARIADALHDGALPHEILLEFDISLPTVYAIKRGDHPHQISETVYFDADMNGWEVDAETLQELEVEDEREAQLEKSVRRLMDLGSDPIVPLTNTLASEAMLKEERVRTEARHRKRAYHMDMATQRNRSALNAKHTQQARELRRRITEERSALRERLDKEQAEAYAALDARHDELRIQHEARVQADQTALLEQEHAMVHAREEEHRKELARIELIAQHGFDGAQRIIDAGLDTPEEESA